MQESQFWLIRCAAGAIAASVADLWLGNRDKRRSQFSVPLSQFSPCMLIGASFCPRGKHTILFQRSDLKIAFAYRFLVFAIACSCFCGRAASRWQLQDFNRVEKSLANQVNSIAAFDATPRRCPLVIEFYMPPGHRSSRQGSGLEKAAVEQPSINAKIVSRIRHGKSDGNSLADRLQS